MTTGNLVANRTFGEQMKFISALMGEELKLANGIKITVIDTYEEVIFAAVFKPESTENFTKE